MKNESKNLRIYSIVFLVFAICKIIMYTIVLLSGELSVESMAQQANADVQLTLIVTVLVLILSWIVAIGFLYLGIQGLRQVKGNYKGGAHIVIAVICSVIELGFLISLFIRVLGGHGDFGVCLSHLINLCFLVPYIKWANSIRKN